MLSLNNQANFNIRILSFSLNLFSYVTFILVTFECKSMVLTMGLSHQSLLTNKSL